MENKCKNCISFHPALWHADGTKGVCDQCGELIVKDREDECPCGSFIELPKIEKIKRTINKVLSPWIRERDDMFKRSMELVCHIGQLFEMGEFKIFDAVKAAQDMKSLVFHNKDAMINIDTLWTYHCPWDYDREHFIILTSDSRMIINNWNNNENKFIISSSSIENDFGKSMEMIDKIRNNCIMKIMVSEVEENKCVYESFSN